ncbi:MAG TPA: ABC transporter permease [Cyclobacteriaceae bacterium]|nr:ABC transporter permease [Cyclobacteriaceae bacterium]
MEQQPPRLFHRFFRWYCHPKLVQHIEGDLIEEYNYCLQKHGKRTADFRFALDVLLLFRKKIIRPAEGINSLNSYGMYKNYVKVGWRSLLRNGGYSFINISGLAIGLAVAMLIGLWVWDELSYDSYHKNNDRIAAVLQNMTYGEMIETSSSESFQLGGELRASYGNNFKHVVMKSFTQSPILTYGEKAITQTGSFMEPDGPELLSFEMISGVRDGLTDLNAILLSESAAKALFGDQTAVGEMIKIDNQFDVTVAGVYKDFPLNSSFKRLKFAAPLDLLVRAGGRNFGWINNWLEVLVELEDGVDMATASQAIKDAKLKKVDPSLAKFKPELFLFPLSKWRLYDNFQGGVSIGGRIEYVILFGTIGLIVLALACINFTNLCTARAENRAREVGVRKVVGSLRSQLIAQFFTESFLMVSLAFVVGLLLTWLSLPLFNLLSDKSIEIQWTNSWMWLGCLGVALVTALVAGSYPSFYLSSFSPAKVLKGTFKTGSVAALPRKILVVLQFTASVTLVIGTIVVYQQVQFARNRPLGYHKNGLLFVPMKTIDAKKNYNAFKNELLAQGLATDVSRSECVVTEMYYSDGGFQWKGKDPDMQDNIYRGAIDFDFGKTVGWKIKEGRDFSREYASDSLSMILNEAAVTYMGLKNPVGEIVKRYGQDYTVIGVVEDMISQSPYLPNQQTYYVIDGFNFARYVTLKLNPSLSLNESLVDIERVFKNVNKDVPFEYYFGDEEVAGKFADEARFGNLVGIFAILAVVISCLGLFGLAAFIASKRTKEIGIRKVLGASVFSVWRMLSKDFVILTVISIAIAAPIAYMLTNNWLQQYTYKTDLSWQVFVFTGLGLIAVTLMTVSFQSIRAALENPVKSLKSE